MNEAPQQSTRRTILVVDNHAAICVTLAYRLEFNGYHVLTAESGPVAMQLAAKEAIDGALIDVHMPVMNGFDTCLRLQAQSRAVGRVLHVWFMTGAFTQEVEQRARMIGALGVMTKPFDHVRLLSELDRVLSAPLTPSGHASSAENAR